MTGNININIQILSLTKLPTAKYGFVSLTFSKMDLEHLRRKQLTWQLNLIQRGMKRGCLQRFLLLY